MTLKRMPPQIRKLAVGNKLQFIRDCKVGNVWYRKGRIVYVLDTDRSVTLLGMCQPLRDITGMPRNDWVFYHKGFKYCRYIGTVFLFDHCRHIK